MGQREWWRYGGEERTYSAYDRIVASEMCFAVLAAEDLVGVEVDVVCEPHPCRFWVIKRRRGGSSKKTSGFAECSSFDSLERVTRTGDCGGSLLRI